VTAVAATIPRPAVILRLVAGRGTFRIGVQIMAIVLVAVWGTGTFAAYANALGMFTWLSIAVATPEKTALKVLPRTRLLVPALAETALILSCVPVLALLAALVAAAALAPVSATTTYLAAATWMACTGLLMTVSGLHRLRGRPDLDAAAFGCSAGVVLLATAATWHFGLAPPIHLLLLVAGTVLVTGYALATLPRGWLRPGPGSGHRLLPRFARTTALLGTTDVLDTLGPAVVYLALAASGQLTGSGPLYLAMLGSTMVGQLVFFLLRVAAPATSARLRGTGGAAGRVRALRLLRLAERAGVGFAVGFAVVAGLPATRVWLTGANLAGALVVLVGIEIGLFLAVLYAGYLLENTDDKILVVTSTSALAGLLATGVLAVVLVPLLGAAGGLAVLVLAVTVKGSTMRRMLLRARPELSTR
jgi:hypothetical protein